jgi:uncharacterized protein
VENQKLIEIKELAKDLMIKRKAHNEREYGSVFYHGERVAKTAVQLRGKISPLKKSIDNLLVIASWFHDISKGIEPHAHFGAIITKDILKDNLATNDLNMVVEMIDYHCYRKPENNNYPDYVKIIQDADLIDHFGTYEIWMNIQYQAHTNGSINDLIDYYMKNHSIKVEKHRKLLNYDLSKKIYDEKVAFEKMYYDRLRIEGIGEIYKLDQF